MTPSDMFRYRSSRRRGSVSIVRVDDTLVLLCYKDNRLLGLPARQTSRLIWKENECRPSEHPDG